MLVWRRQNPNWRGGLLVTGITGASSMYHSLKDGLEERQPKSVVPYVGSETSLRESYGMEWEALSTRLSAFKVIYGTRQFLFGKERGLGTIRREMENLKFVTRLNINCDFWTGRSFDIPLDEASAELRSNEFQSDGIPMDGTVEFIIDSPESKKVTQMPDVVLAVSSLRLYKLVPHPIKLCINKHGLRDLQTSTPSLSATKADNGEWVIETPRGSVIAKKVDLVYASNAFTTTLLPEFWTELFLRQCSVTV